MDYHQIISALWLSAFYVNIPANIPKLYHCFLLAKRFLYANSLICGNLKTTVTFLIIKRRYDLSYLINGRASLVFGRVLSEFAPRQVSCWRNSRQPTMGRNGILCLRSRPFLQRIALKMRVQPPDKKH
jgi:hypothetical protein